jgi:hypothetical protein
MEWMECLISGRRGDRRASGGVVATFHQATVSAAMVRIAASPHGLVAAAGMHGEPHHPCPYMIFIHSLRDEERDPASAARIARKAQSIAGEQIMSP